MLPAHLPAPGPVLAPAAAAAGFGTGPAGSLFAANPSAPRTAHDEELQEVLVASARLASAAQHAARERRSCRIVGDAATRVAAHHAAGPLPPTAAAGPVFGAAEAVRMAAAVQASTWRRRRHALLAREATLRKDD